MTKRKQDFEREHAAFQERIAEIEKTPTARGARKVIKELDTMYRGAAIAHWKTLGNRASTGYGQTPEGQFQSPRTPANCAEEVARGLMDGFVFDSVHGK